MKEAKGVETRGVKAAENSLEEHNTTLSLVDVPPGEVAAGADMVLRAAVSCSSGCDLSGKIITVIDGRTVAKEVELTKFDTATETDEFVVKAPIESGEYRWTVAFPAQEKEGTLHRASSVQFPLVVKPHSTSVTVWDVAAPVSLGTTIRLKVGVKCSSACNLEGKEVEIYDSAGTKIATARLGSTLWPGTSAMYWAEMEVKSPGAEGYHQWKARFPDPGLRASHEKAQCLFGFSVVRPPEHVVTIEVIDQSTEAPIKNAHLRLGAYAGDTDDSGFAKLEVTQGEYRLSIWAPEKHVFETDIVVSSDTALKAELVHIVGRYVGG